MKTFGKLREEIRAKFQNTENFAKAMEMDRSTLSGKLNSKTGWKQTEIEKACKLLDIPMEEVVDYFFYD